MSIDISIIKVRRLTAKKSESNVIVVKLITKETRNRVIRTSKTIKLNTMSVIKPHKVYIEYIVRYKI